MKSVADWKVVSMKDGAKAEVLADKNRILVTVPKPTARAWDVLLHSPPLAGELKKGEKLFLTYSLKNNGSTAPPPRIALYLEPVKGSGSQFNINSQTFPSEVKLQETWTVDADYPSNSLRLSMHLGSDANTTEVGPLTAVVYSPEVTAESLPTTPLQYLGRDADAPWRQAAAERIRKYRMAPMQLHVVNTAGKPVKDASIQWDQLSHAFGFGCFCEHPLVATDADGENYRQHFKDLFNYATVPAYNAEWGWLKESNRGIALQIADWLEKQSITARGHLLVYPGWVASPPAWRDISPLERKEKIEAHIPIVLNALSQRSVNEYDVVNELRDNIGFCDDLAKPSGGTGLDLVCQWFKDAQRLAPQAKLYINEYWILAGGGYTTKQQDLYESTIQQLLAKGAHIHGIGMQGHFSTALTPPPRLIELLDRFAKLGLRIRITEFDVDVGDEAAQADYTRDFYTALYSHPAVDGIVQWGFWEGQQWKPRAAMLRKDWSPKPNFTAFKKLTKETLASHFTGKTNAAGSWGETVHMGKHLLKLKTQHYEKEMIVEVSSGGNTLNIVVP